MLKKVALALAWVMILGTYSTAHAQQTEPGLNDWAAAMADNYTVYPDQQYGFASNVPLKLDVWQAQTKQPAPTLIYYHGGGWWFGDRMGAVPLLMPWLARGWNVVNVEYRMLGTARWLRRRWKTRVARYAGFTGMQSSSIWIRTISS